MSARTPIETVEKLASLARISIPEDRKETIAAEFDSVVTYISQLEELEVATSGIPRVPPLHNVFREDTDPTTPGSWTEKIVEAFPQKSGNALTVKKILSHD